MRDGTDDQTMPLPGPRFGGRARTDSWHVRSLRQRVELLLVSGARSATTGAAGRLGGALEEARRRHPETELADVLPRALELQRHVGAHHVEVAEVTLDPLALARRARAAGAEHELDGLAAQLDRPAAR